MDISLLSLISFTIITIIYFAFPSIGKPQLTLNDLENNETMMGFYNKNIYSLAFYIGIVVISQFFLNTSYLISKCGGSINKNIGAAALFTFIPWLLIFAVMVAVLIIFPGFKTAFSDVIGYFVVSSSANELLSSILRGTDLNEMIDKTNDQNEKSELTKAADAILKICGNIWNILKPLMNAGAYDNTEIKTKLLDLVVLKDNIGEALWYIYTAILISSIVNYNLATRGCVKDISQIKSEHDEYIKQQEDADKQKELNNTTTYTSY